MKAMLIVVFDCQGVMYYVFARRDQTLSQEFCGSTRSNMEGSIKTLVENNWCLHNSSVVHIGLLAQKFFMKNKTPVAPPPPYSTAVSPA